jgi:hypothetical protein
MLVQVDQKDQKQQLRNVPTVVIERSHMMIHFSNMPLNVQNEFYSWIHDDEGCSRWLCNYCRIKLAIPTGSLTWFCDDHVDMHKEDDNFEQEQSSKLIQEMINE